MPKANTSTTSPQVNQTFDQLDEELQLLLEHLSSDDEEIRDLAEEIFSELIPQLEKKIDGYVAIIQKKKAHRDYRKTEAQRISKLAASDENVIDWLTEKLLGFMERRVEVLGEKGKKLEGMFSKISLCANGGKPSVWINRDLPTLDFPEEYVEFIPTLNTQKLAEDAIASPEGEILDEKGQLLAKVMPKGRHIRIS